MTLLSFMEAMGSSSIPLIAAFFIGLMTAISPCPLATNLTAIAYVSKRIDNSGHTLLVGFLYTLGRMFTYVLIASMIVLLGLNTRAIALFLQAYGEKLLGPLLIVVGILMLDILKISLGENNRLYELKEKLANRGYLGSFLLGAVFALAFCPFSGVLFFGMLIPLAIKAGDGLIIPAVFALATGLPVVLFSFLLSRGLHKLSKVLNKVSAVEAFARKLAAVVFIVAGIIYTTKFLAIP